MCAKSIHQIRITTNCFCITTVCQSSLSFFCLFYSTSIFIR
nr:MAG TPA: hypothetical protein [Caudoviricetes sp.]DAJ92026.1 MAG TPA: hypothetical protein [Caudoviricetes sp.]